MAVLSAAYAGDARFTDKPPRRGRFLLVSGEVLYNGALVGIHDGTGSGTQGQVAAYDANTTGLRFLGVHVGEDTTGDGSLHVTVDYSGLEAQRVDVTGVSAATVVGDLVYCDSDNIDDATLTRPSGALEHIGVVMIAEDTTNAVATVLLKDGIEALRASQEQIRPKTVATAIVADGAISLPVDDIEFVELDGTSATARTTLAVPNDETVGKRLFIACSNATNTVDVDFTDFTGASVTYTFAAGEGIMLYAASTTGWAISSGALT